MFESLESRRMLSITIVGARITIDGTADSDVITVDQTGPKSYDIFENGTTTSVSSNRVVKQIVINGLGDDDCLALFPSVVTPATLNGNDGNDTLVGGNAADKFVGGADIDTADYSFRGQYQPPQPGYASETVSAVLMDNLRLSLNNVADDGRFGEGDNIMTDVENIIGGCGNDVIVGQILSPVDNFFDGGGGDDDIRAMGGDDLVFGGMGNDSLDGGAGNDTLAGHYGQDYILGGDGDDLIEANDGEMDTVIGGAGWDTVWADSGNPVVDNVNAEDVFLI